MTKNSRYGIWFPNKAVLELFAPQDGLEGLEQLFDLFDMSCRIFRPAWAGLGAPDWPVMDINEQLVGVPKVSWVNYFSSECRIRCVRPVLPELIGSGDSGGDENRNGSGLGRAGGGVAKEREERS